MTDPSGFQASAAALRQASFDNDYLLQQQFYQAALDVSKSSIDRSRDSAKYIQTAAAAIATLYTGALALVYSVSTNPLPVRGIWSAAFLGLAVALSSAYLAFIRPLRSLAPLPEPANLTEAAFDRVGYFIRWTNAAIENRRWAIRAAVLSLLFGVVFIPAAFIGATKPTSPPSPPVLPTYPVGLPAAQAKLGLTIFQTELAQYKTSYTRYQTALKQSTSEQQKVHAHDIKIDHVSAGLAAAGLICVVVVPAAWSRRD